MPGKPTMAHSVNPELSGDRTVQTGGENAPTLRVHTEPADARVLLHDRVLGSPPLVSSELPPGLHQVTVEKDGFAPLTLRLYLPKNGTVNLWRIPLARQDSLLTVWRVGSPHDGGTPAARIPGELEALITASGFRVRTLSFAAAAFPDEFARARQEGGHAIPDVVTGTNYLPLQGVVDSGPSVRGVLTMIDPIVFLVSRSPGHVAAHQVACINRGIGRPGEPWSLDEPEWQDLPGQLPSPDKGSLED